MHEFYSTNLPVFKRTRGYRLYTENGGRYLDFFQEGGKSILGSRPRGFSLALKNEIEKGNFFNYPSGYGKKVLRALEALSGIPLRASFFTSARDACAHISEAEKENFTLCGGSDAFMAAEALYDASDRRGLDKKRGDGKPLVYCWYPLCGIPLPFFLEYYRYVMPVLPFPGSFAPAVLISAEAEIKGNPPPSPFLLAGLASVICSLSDHIQSSPYSHWDEEKHLKRIKGIWKVRTPYLIPSYPRDRHEFVYNTFLERKIVIQPDFSGISALPAEISEGERMLFLETADIVARGII